MWIPRTADGILIGVSMLARGDVLWRAIGIVAVTQASIVVRGLLAERSRRKTLSTLCGQARSGTVVILGKGPGGPAMAVRIGDGPPVRPGQRVSLYSNEQPSRRRWSSTCDQDPA